MKRILLRFCLNVYMNKILYCNMYDKFAYLHQKQHSNNNESWALPYHCGQVLSVVKVAGATMAF